MFRSRDDNVFQLSLTELAFVLTFVVLLLLGSRFVLSEKTCRHDIEACGKDLVTCKTERDNCYSKLPAALGDPQEVIDSLVNAPKLREENNILKSELAAQRAELEALQYIKKENPKAADVKKAMDFMRSYQETSRVPINESTAAVQGGKAGSALREFETCSGQLKHCIQVTGARKGYGHPPCWTDATGKIQYLFEIEIGVGGLKVARAWPDERDADARELPGAQTVLKEGTVSLDQFKTATLDVFNISRKANPECRHYVVLKRDPALRSIDEFNRLRLGIEDYFYKFDQTGVRVSQ